MNEPTTAPAAASTAAEAVRALNHLTTCPALSDLADVCALIAQLQALAERLPQALGQLATVLEAPALGVEYGVDNDADPHDVVGDAVIALRAGADRAHDLGRRLCDAQSAVGHLYIARELTAVDVESDE
jgi:hypothetical protein